MSTDQLQYLYTIFTPSPSGSVDSKRSSSHIITLLSKDELCESLSRSTTSVYERSASIDINSLFMPYSSVSGNRIMPCIPSGIQSSESDVTMYDLLPFSFNPTSGEIVDRTISTSGDSLAGLANGSEFTNELEDFRDIQNIRGIGLRLPMMGVGWGYTTNDTPYPYDPVNPEVFINGSVSGTSIPSQNYVAAPIDFKFDEDRGVWVAGGATRKHRHLLNTASDGGPAFATFFADTRAEASGLGYLRLLPKLALL